ncbi:MAG: formylmethanofuran dehydrogenase subunit A [Candidatus Hydrothermarchaeales archaeon]
MKLALKNGIVYDPLNNIRGEKKDILIKDGKVVEKLWGRRKTIDVSNKVVMPGGIDIHSHIAGGKVNVGRSFRPEDHEKFVVAKNGITRSGSGFSTPSTFITGYLYSKMGYTTVFTPAMPPLMARHTHEELHDLPMIDKASYALCDGNWFIMRYLKNGEIEKCAAYVAWLLRATKGLVIKLTNPGGTEAWGWGKDCRSLNEPVPHFGITPAEIIEGLIKVNELLGLPHSVHLHTNNLGRLGNWSTTVETFKIANGLKSNNGRQSLHVAHAQFHAYGGSTWKDFESKADEVVKGLMSNDSVTIDTGNVTLDETTTMTADGPMEYYLQSLTHLKWANRGVEMETSPGVTPFVYSKKKATSSIQWGIGLELALLLKDPWKVLLSTDHPNGGPFIRYPRIKAWLMSSKYREKSIKEVHKAIGKRGIIPTIDREYDLYEIAVITSAAAAKAFGFEKDKGHLGPGAIADVAVYDIDAEKINGNDYEELEKKFANTAYTLKDGEVVVKDGEIVKVVNGRTYWANAKVGESLEKEVMKDIDYNFKRYYSVNLANYPVHELYLTRPTEIKIDASSRVT